MDASLVLPNTFLIGAQKCATTSVYNWLAQHPEICAPISLKDYDFYIDDEKFVTQGFNKLSSHYNGYYTDEKVIMQGSVHYIFFEKALQRISKKHPDSKCILIVRNPLERAISSYKYAVKFNFENLTIQKAFLKENERLSSQNLRVQYEQTYKAHSLYYKQIISFLKYFKPNQLKVILYEDITKQPEKVTEELFSFLGVDATFIPEYKVLNTTGSLKSKKLQKFIFGKSKLREFLVKSIFNKLVSEDFKSKLRWKIIHMNTKNATNKNMDVYDNTWLKEQLAFFEKDINQLEILLEKDLSHWKKLKD